MRFAELWSLVLVPRLDTAMMQEGTGAAGRIWPGWLAPEEVPGLANGEQGGRVLIEPGRGVAPAVLTSANLEVVRFVLVTEVNDYEPPPPIVFDPLVPLELMQEEGRRLLDGWHPDGVSDPALELKIGVRIKLEVPPQKSPQWDESMRRWWLSSIYRFEAARR